MFFEDLRSERQLIRVVSDRLSLRWYVGYDLQEPLPDYSSLTRIRDEAEVEASATTLTEIFGIGPILAAKIMGTVGNATRFPTTRPTTSPPTPVGRRTGVGLQRRGGAPQALAGRKPQA
jgi:hypothetical protein